ncbi:MAG: flagellar FliJ family protein [Terriglobales bacterium]
MPFHFPLAAVLRFRESIEQREHLALETIQRDISRVELRIREVEEADNAATKIRTDDLAHGKRAASMQSEYQHQSSLARQREGFESLLQELKIKWRQQLAAYQLARRNRETLEKLRENQLDAYTREQNKREQAVIDDIFLSRRGRHK